MQDIDILAKIRTIGIRNFVKNPIAKYLEIAQNIFSKDKKELHHFQVQIINASNVKENEYGSKENV